MARDNKSKSKSKAKAEPEDSTPSTPVQEEKPRPGTSGTEALLVTNRREAAQHYQKAQRAEHSYRAKKRATAARRDYHDAKGHFKESARHFKTGAKMMFGAIKCFPYIFGEKNEERRKKKTMAERKRLEEQLARQNDDGEDDDAESKN